MKTVEQQFVFTAGANWSIVVVVLVMAESVMWICKAMLMLMSKLVLMLMALVSVQHDGSSSGGGNASSGGPNSTKPDVAER